MRQDAQPKLYFAYGSNMNLEQMARRCPSATKVAPVTLTGYRLAFRGRHRDGNGVATIIPDCKKVVPGLLWRITPECEKNLDIYEGYPRMYTKETIMVWDADGREYQAMVYIMTSEYDQPSEPSNMYFFGILKGYTTNGINYKPLYEAAGRTTKEIKAGQKSREHKSRGNNVPGQQKLI